MEESIFSLIPPAVAIILVLLTRRVLLSLGAGIIIGALLLNHFQLWATFTYLVEIIRDLFFSQNSETGSWGLNQGNVYILLFLILLGIITALISMSGGTRAFGDWAIKHIKSRVGAEIFTIILGIIIFIDDYFNALAVGNISRPLTDRHHISRAKLAYYIDSTAAPVCVISPVSSWGAYIIGLIGSILAAHNITDISGFEGFLNIAGMNFYAILALLMVFSTAIFRINLGAMRSHENFNTTDKGKVETAHTQELPESKKGRVADLVWPIISLVVGTVGAMIYTGYKASGNNVNLMTIFVNTDVAKSLLLGGIIGLIVTLIFYLPKKFSMKTTAKGFWKGTESMLPAILILLFAWTITTVIDGLGTGQYLADIVKNTSLPIGFMPMVLFLTSGIMAFATGTSWGTFGIMLPIAGQIAAGTDIDLMLPMLAAVLSGSVFGDHCSPISDTTILSSTGAGVKHIDHVLTQLPYAISIAVIASLAYIVLGFTASLTLGLLVAIVLFVLMIFILRVGYTGRKA